MFPIGLDAFGLSRMHCPQNPNYFPKSS